MSAAGSDSDVHSNDTDDNNEEDYVYEEVVYVHGAGSEMVNGVYERAPDEGFDGVGKYIKTETCRWDGEDRQQLTLFRCPVSSGGKYWYISIGPTDVRLGTSLDIDFYCAETLSAPADAQYPPTYGWIMSSEDREPVPHVTMHIRNRPYANYIAPTVSVVTPVASIFRGMLCSEEFSDCKFVCQDGQVIPAHKCILAASSPYFKAAFSGQWRDADELGTVHPAHIIKAMLRIIYTGNYDDMKYLVEEDPLAFMSIASEYDLSWLKVIIEPICVRSVCLDRLKDCWQAARLFDNALLKSVCLDYARSDAVAALASKEIASLQIEDPMSWKELTQSIAEENKDESH